METIIYRRTMWRERALGLLYHRHNVVTRRLTLGWGCESSWRVDQIAERGGQNSEPSTPERENEAAICYRSYYGGTR